MDGQEGPKLTVGFVWLELLRREQPTWWGGAEPRKRAWGIRVGPAWEAG